MNNDSAPVGRRFSHVYLERGTPTRDSERFRRRIAGYFFDRLGAVAGDVARTIESELGVKVPHSDWGHFLMGEFFAKAEMRDVLDSVTLVHRVLRSKRIEAQWLDFVARAFGEENLGYRLDKEGGVHFAIDAQFERTRAATLAGLGGSRYQTALSAFEEAHRDFDSRPPDTRGAVRATFDAVENVFRLICPRAPRLGAAEITQYLAPGVEAAYSSDVTAKRSVKKILASLGEWVDAVHFYRHAPGTEEPAPPSIELAVLMVSEGSAFLRWLVDFDRAALAKAPGGAGS